MGRRNDTFVKDVRIAAGVELRDLGSTRPDGATLRLTEKYVVSTIANPCRELYHEGGCSCNISPGSIR